MAKDTNLQGLNAIAVACGGAAQESNAKAIKEIADNFSGGGGGGGNLVVTINKTVDGETTTYTANKTAGEIKAALLAGQLVVIPFSAVDEGGNTSYASAIIDDDNFIFLQNSGGGYVLALPPTVMGSVELMDLTAATESDYPTGIEGDK